MTEIYLHFIFAHYRLYGNAPVLEVRFMANGSNGAPRASYTEQFTALGLQGPSARDGFQLCSGGHVCVNRTALKVCSQPAGPSGASRVSCSWPLRSATFAATQFDVVALEEETNSSIPNHA